ncbi:alpha/beta fold hydrolase [Paenibacillus hodogayensis]|uniref:Alpha/beta fold hydrolase n=1 Tax=Paenibacillus hodogayensis TaxID=279208 RepID=A0ABV5VV29_9BACL
MDNTRSQFTTKDGFNMEYRLIGQGDPVLVLHGGHSNCDETFGYSELTARHFSVITPSRPGYGKTSKELGATMASACEAYIGLLDHLQISQAHVIGISAGGPSGIHLASRYPHRVKSLVLQSAVSQRWLLPDDNLYKSAKMMFRPSTEAYLWASIRLINALFPAFLFNSMLASFSKLPKEKVLPQISEEDRKQFKSMLNRQRSKHGFLLDLDQTGHDLTAELLAVQCPALILHSIHDASVPVEHARYAHRHIPNAQLCELDSWGHLIWLGSGNDIMYQKLFAFLDRPGERSFPHDHRT